MRNKWPLFGACFLNLAIGVARVAETGADCRHAPVEVISNVGQLAQTLHDRIIVHDNHQFAVADFGDLLTDYPWEIEARAFPIARQILSMQRELSYWRMITQSSATTR